MKKALFYILSLTLCTVSNAQRKLSKQEIASYWTTRVKLGRDSTKQKLFKDLDSISYLRVIKLIDSLHTSKIDTIIVYTQSLPGYTTNTEYGTGSYPIYPIVIWKSLKYAYAKKIRGNYETNINLLSSADIFDFYAKNTSIIQKENFMPVIYEGSISAKGEISYACSFSFHQPNYSITYLVGKYSSEIVFNKEELTDKKSLFYEDNIRLKSYEWWKIIKRELNQ